MANDGTERVQRRRRVAGWLAGLLASVASAAIVAWFTSSLALRGHAEESLAVFNAVGIRYFYAVHSTFWPGGTAVTPERQVAYRALLLDIQEDMRWVRSYSFLAKRSTRLAFVQNAIAAELALDAAGMDSSTLSLMCLIYVDSKLWGPTEHEGELEVEVREFAHRLCAGEGRLRETWRQKAIQ